jgi:uncharacterized protein YycO
MRKLILSLAALMLIILTTSIFSTLSAKSLIRSELKNGDFIFQNMDCGPMCEAIEAVTDGYKGNDFSHMGMVFHLNDSIFVIEAIGPGVMLTPIDQFLARSLNEHWVGRVKRKYQFLIPQALGFALLCKGMAYDHEFLYDNGKYYCSELIYDAFKHANNGKPFFQLYPMTYKSPNSNTFYPVWITHFAQLNMSIPEGLPGCNPGGMSLSNKINILGKLN